MGSHVSCMSIPPDAATAPLSVRPVRAKPRKMDIDQNIANDPASAGINGTNNTNTATTVRVMPGFTPNLNNIIEAPVPIKAAELMIDHPGHFLCACINLNKIINANYDPNYNPNGVINPRIIPVPADEELSPDFLYILLPMNKRSGRFTDQEMALLAANALAATALANPATLSKLRAANLMQICSRKVSPDPLDNDDNDSLINSDDVQTIHQLRQPFRCFSDRLSNRSSAINNLAIQSGDMLNLLNNVANYSCNAGFSAVVQSTSVPMMCRSRSWVPKLETITEFPPQINTTTSLMLRN